MAEKRNCVLDARLSDEQLRMPGGQHQKYVTFGGKDQYLLSYEQGMAHLHTCILEYLHAQRQGDEAKYALILYLNREGGDTTDVVFSAADLPPWLKDMEAIYRGKEKPSHDPRRHGSGPSVNLDDDDIQPPSGGEADAASGREQTGAMDAASQVSAEENELRQVTEVIDHCSQVGRRVAIVYRSPDTMFADASANAPVRARKIREIAAWARYDMCDSYLIISRKPRATEFRAALENSLGEDNAKPLELEPPNREVFKAFCQRLLCLNRDKVTCQDLDTIAITAEARGVSLLGFMEDIEDKYRRHLATANGATGGHHPFALDDIYLEGDKVRTAEEVMKEIEDLVGLDQVKALAKRWCEQVEQNRKQKMQGGMASPVEVPHMLFVGDPGTGKTVVAELLGKLLMALGIRKGQKVTTITYSNIASSFNHSEMVVNMNRYVNQAISDRGVLFIDEAYRFADSSWGCQAFETLIDTMERHRHDFTLILAGYKDRCQALYRINAGLKSRLKEIEFKTYNEGELKDIVKSLFRRSLVCRLPENGEVEGRLNQCITSLYRRGQCQNGRGARNLFKEIEEACRRRRGEGRSRVTVTAEDIPEPPKMRPLEAQRWLAGFKERFMGLSKVKAFLEELYAQCEKRDERLRDENYDMSHEAAKLFNCFFVGAPGTGKTSVAREMADYLYLLGVTVREKQFVEAGLSDFVSSYTGEFSTLVKNKFEEAKGGILFIDEAYTLAQDEQGRKILHEIVTNITLPEFTDVVVIMAGYEDNMNELFRLNPGLQRRMPYLVTFENYSPRELAEIFMHSVNEDSMYSVDPAHKAGFQPRLEGILYRMSQQRNFGNAGSVKDFYERVCNACDRREKRLGGERPHQLQVIDLSLEESSMEAPEDVFMDIRANFVGMEDFIDALRQFHDKRQRAHLLAEIFGYEELAESYNPNNLIIRGPSGCGKTALAPYLARLFAAWGDITHREPRIVRGQELTGEYLGQTKKKVLDEFANAQDRLLFIDEAYGILSGHGNDQFGQEAISTLVGCLTDPKNSSTIVILAGYPQEMRQLLDSNPGLLRRFPNSYEITPFDADKLADIVMLRLEKERYVWRNEADKTAFRDKLRRRFGQLLSLDSTGNADEAIRLHRRIVEEHGDKVPWERVQELYSNGELTDEDRLSINCLSVEDIPGFTVAECVEGVLKRMGLSHAPNYGEKLRSILVKSFNPLPDGRHISRLIEELQCKLPKYGDSWSPSQEREVEKWVKQVLESEI